MRPEKTLLLDEIKEKIDASTAMIVARYNQLAPNPSWDFRDRLAKSGASFEVVKKRLFIRAANDAGIEIEERLLKGHVGIVFVEQPDAMPSAKVLFKFSKENGGLLEVICGKIEGRMIPGSEIEALSKLPGMEELRAKLLSVLIAPMTETLSTLEAVMSGPLSILEQKS